MALPSDLRDRLALPVFVAPMFLVSTPALAIASCAAGLVGSLTRNHCRDLAEMEAQLRARRVGLDELLASSDILSLHAPLTEATRQVINARSLAAMKPGAILINTSRGGLIDEAALHAALISGHLRGAGLDAFDPEPPSMDNPLLQLEQVVLTPHAGGGVFDNVEHVARHAFGNLACWQRGLAVTAPDLILAPAGANA